MNIIYFFRNFKTPSDSTKRFKFYLAYVFGIGAALGLFVIWSLVESYSFHRFGERVAIFLALTFPCMAILDVVFLIIGAVKIFQMSESFKSSDNSRFEAEKERFWSYVQLFLIMMVTWPAHLLSWDYYASLSSIIASDSIKCFSSFMIFTIFCLNKSVRELIQNRWDTFRYKVETLTPESP
jgi:hypothetical protein